MVFICIIVENIIFIYKWKFMGNIRKHRTTQEYIEEVRKIHCDKYDYSLTVFKKLDDKIKIICPIHGVFEQIARNHLHGEGCMKCKNEAISQKYRSNKEEFIEKARNVHGEIYDYTLVDYINSQTKVKIICPVHGVFEQKPNNHLSGYGCKKCADEATHNKQRLNKQEFIDRAKIVHGDKYDYTLVEYKALNKKVKIVCPVHGVFEQTPGNHLAGWGCSTCSQSHLEKEVFSLLENEGYEFETQKTFGWLRYENPMSLDFYIPKLKIGIECQGAQHYRVVDFSGHNENRAIKQFELIQRRDILKERLCKEHGIRLYYYTHETKPGGETYNNLDLLFEEIKNQL